MRKLNRGPTPDLADLKEKAGFWGDHIFLPEVPKSPSARQAPKAPDREKRAAIAVPTVLVESEWGRVH